MAYRRYRRVESTSSDSSKVPDSTVPKKRSNEANIETATTRRLRVSSIQSDSELLNFLRGMLPQSLMKVTVESISSQLFKNAQWIEAQDNGRENHVAEVT